MPWSREFSAASPGPRFRLTRSHGPRAATMKERRASSSEVGPCHAGREAGICITLVLSAMYDTSTGSIHAGAGYRQPAEQGTECIIFHHPSQWLAGIRVSRWANGQSFNQFVARCKMVQGERHPSLGSCHAARMPMLFCMIFSRSRYACVRLAYVGVHPARAPTPLVPCSGPTSRGVPESELRMRKLKLEKRAHAAPRSCYHVGTRVRESA